MTRPARTSLTGHLPTRPKQPPGYPLPEYPGTRRFNAEAHSYAEGRLQQFINVLGIAELELSNPDKWSKTNLAETRDGMKCAISSPVCHRRCLIGTFCSINSSICLELDEWLSKNLLKGRTVSDWQDDLKVTHSDIQFFLKEAIALAKLQLNQLTSSRS